MSIDLANALPIDEGAAEHQEWLSRLQGNILRSHGRDHSAHVFLRLPEDVRPARAVVTSLLPYLTSARTQYADTIRYRETHQGQTLFGTLSLSATGYRALGLEDLTGFHEPKDGVGDPDACFLDGMGAHPDDLGDPPVCEWETPFRDRIDAMLLLAHDSERHLTSALERALGAIAPSHVLATERGQVIRNEAEEPLEHFGFVDGRSQPLYLADDFKLNPHGRPTRERRTGRLMDQWDPFERLDRVLRTDPFGTDSFCLGSFLVFRKLEQDVRGFAEAEARLACALGLRGPAAERAGAMVVGRFRDGSPLTLSAAPGWYPSNDNDFTYAADIHGWRCPAFAHVRRMNPRGSASAESERKRRLTRRGVTYGASSAGLKPGASQESLPEKGVGLLFMAYQASVRRQFAFVQKRWVADPHFPQTSPGEDPMLGGAEGRSATHEWCQQFNDGVTRPHSFGTHVRMLGGEFFFTPSLAFLQAL
jgi:Dyp-type peroxidase family